MLGHLLLPEIEDMIRSGDFAGLRDALADFVPPDIAELIGELPPEDQAVIFRILPRQLAAETFEYLPLEAQEQLIKALGQEQVADILNNMAPDDRTHLLEELPGEVTRRLMNLLSPQELATAKQLLGYPEGTVGRLMTPDYVTIRSEWTVDQVLKHIRTYGRDSETLTVFYVTNERGKLIDDLPVRDILLSPPDVKIESLLDDDFVSLKATDDQETAVATFRKYDVEALPVVDSDGALVGIVTVDDVFDVAEEEATEDIQKFGGMEALEEPYLTTSILSMVRKRAGWLVILFVGGLFTVKAIQHFEGELKNVLVLSWFLTLIIASGGNSGSQAATLVIRALSLGELTLKQWWVVLRKEIVSGVILGSILAVAGFARVALLAKEITAKGNSWLLVASTVAFTLFGVVTFGTIIGSMLPFILKRLGADPATSSSPFIATLIDVAGIVIYFSIAALIIF